MWVQIFDVEHGQCSLVTTDNGSRILVDCGHNTSTGWRPSEYLERIGVSSLDALFVTNFDEDHASDLPNLARKVAVPNLISNTSVTGPDLYRLKRRNGMGNGIAALAEMKSGYGAPGVGTPVDFGVRWQVFYNLYPSEFDDENNLSLVLVMKAHGLTICFPGDMEIAGWKNLLGKPGFKQAMRDVNVLVASHHGRENGCCEELYEETGLYPEATIISDAGKQYATQETVRWYEDRSRGFLLNGKPRSVITTRDDGNVVIQATAQACTLHVRA